MLVAIYNRNFNQENIPFLQGIINRLHSHHIRMVFFKDFYECFKSYMPFEETPMLFFNNLKQLPWGDFFLLW